MYYYEHPQYKARKRKRIRELVVRAYKNDVYNPVREAYAEYEREARFLYGDDSGAGS